MDSYKFNNFREHFDNNLNLNSLYMILNNPQFHRLNHHQLQQSQNYRIRYPVSQEHLRYFLNIQVNYMKV